MTLLPDDLTETILLRLPVFDLGRCKAVCKGWRNLISSPDFVSDHLERSKSDPSSHRLFFHNRLMCDIKLNRPGPFKSFICFSFMDVVLVGSVNGLICVAGNGLPVNDIWIMNPVTGLSRKLPSPVESSVTKLAFWCDSDSVYNVAKIDSDSNGATVLELWVSTSPDKWTTVITTCDFSFRPSLCGVHACDVFVEGLAAYWVLATRGEKIIVVSLDFKTLALKFIPLSEQQLRLCYPKDKFWYVFRGLPISFLFGAYWNGEFVLIIEMYHGYYDVWTMVMDGVNVGWTKKSEICLNCLSFDKCVGCIKGKLLLERRGRVIALFDLGTSKMELFEEESKINVVIDSACGFVGSLVSMDGFSLQFNDLGISWPYSCPLGRDKRWVEKVV